LLENLGKQSKDAMAAYGMAMVISQIFEGSFYMLLTMVEDLVDGPLDDDGMWKVHNKLSKETLGRLVNRAEGRIEFKEKQVEKIRAALDARNYLAHRIYNEEYGNLHTSEGLNEWKRICDEKILIIAEAEKIIGRIVDNLFERYGLDIVEIEKRAKNRFGHI